MQNTQLLGDFRICVSLSKREVSLEVDCIPTGNAVNGPYIGSDDYTFEEVILNRREDKLVSWHVINENGEVIEILVGLVTGAIQMFILRGINTEIVFQQYDGVSLKNINEI